jgi:uncharacterized repeat protein (TIGR02543 family)
MPFFNRYDSSKCHLAGATSERLWDLRDLRQFLMLLTFSITIFSCEEPITPKELRTVEFDLNYQSSTSAPASQTVTKGSLVSKPSDPVRGGYSFVGWYREISLEMPWDFASDTVTVDLILYAKWITVTPSPGQIFSLEFGHTSRAPDYFNPVTLPSGFGNGVLFSVWTKIPINLVAPASFTKLRGNMEVFYLDGDNWHLICLDGNVDGYPDGHALYNANFMLSTTPPGGKGDYCTYLTLERDKLPLATVNSWVWVAWQVVINANQTMTLRQWLKFGIDGTVFAAGQWNITPPGEETVSIANWNPSLPRSFQIGADNTSSGINTGSNSYLCHARMEARSTQPSLLELEAIARLNSADPTAWGDWELNWKDGAPNLYDRSGHDHDLAIQTGGHLYQGVLSPSF